MPRLPEPALGIGQGPVDQRADRVRVERLERQHPRARQQRSDHLERRVLGCRADQDDRSALDVRQQGVLLGLVEAVDLVEEDDRGPPARRELELGALDDRRADP